VDSLVFIVLVQKTWSSSNRTRKFTNFRKNPTPAIPDSFFHGTEFILGAGIVAIQPSAGKIVVVWNGEGRWFLPKGKKDKPESLDKTASREGFEEGVCPSTPSLPPLSPEPDYLIPQRYNQTHSQVIGSYLSLYTA
jgi:hypothetical protein